MFTGLVEEVGSIEEVMKGSVSCQLKIRPSEGIIMSDLKIGDSVAVNGICLTASLVGKDFFTADVMHETLRRTSLRGAAPGCQVNLERAMPCNGRFGGHIVSGHIDGTGVISEIKEDENAVWYRIDADSDILSGIVMKGSVALDGISLTVAGLDDTSFQVSTIPHTRAVTALKNRKKGDLVNIETDVLGKYVKGFLTGEGRREEPESRITEDFLGRYGFI